MKNSEIVEALNNIAPNSEWVLVGDDYENIKWIKGVKPTLKQVQDEVAVLPEKKAAKEAEAQTKRQALLDKLGITEDEARLLLGGN